ncbi:MAG: hypothetical protein ABI583_04580 [Betaproteobacteria bacterium]
MPLLLAAVGCSYLYKVKCTYCLFAAEQKLFNDRLLSGAQLAIDTERGDGQFGAVVQRRAQGGGTGVEAMICSQ